MAAHRTLLRKLLLNAQAALKAEKLVGAEDMELIWSENTKLLTHLIKA
jgi:hypothetical protein